MFEIWLKISSEVYSIIKKKKKTRDERKGHLEITLDKYILFQYHLFQFIEEDNQGSGLRALKINKLSK